MRCHFAGKRPFHSQCGVLCINCNNVEIETLIQHLVFDRLCECNSPGFLRLSVFLFCFAAAAASAAAAALSVFAF